MPFTEDSKVSPAPVTQQGGQDGSGSRAGLARRDIIHFEQRLNRLVLALFPCKGHSLHFPRTAEPKELSWNEREGKLLLPLPSPEALGGFPGFLAEEGKAGGPGRREDAQAQVGERTTPEGAATLAVFVARGADPETVARLSPHWPELARMIMENLLLFKQSLCDPVTGLFTRHFLVESQARAIETLRFSLPGANSGRESVAGIGEAPSTCLQVTDDPVSNTSSQPMAPGGEGLMAQGGESRRRASIGTLVIRFSSLRRVVREFGYQFSDELVIALADALAGICPEQAVAARTGDFEFSLHLPAASAQECQSLAQAAAASLKAVTVVHPLRRERVGVEVSVGYTLYPQDMGGDVFMRPAREQARLILRKARLAAALAAEDRPLLSSREGTSPVLAFNRILSEGGRVLEVLPLSRAVVSLGANMHAHEGQRFSVWSVKYPVQAIDRGGSPGGPMAPLYKGELAIMEVRENVSQAEVISLGDPSWQIEPGDRLVLLPGEETQAPRSGEVGDKLDPGTGLLRHGDFFATWAGAREKCDTFTLALVRIGPPLDRQEGEDQPELADALKESPVDPLDQPYAERAMLTAVRMFRERFGPDLLGGRFGLNSLIFFHPQRVVEEARQDYEEFVPKLEKELGQEVAAGLAFHPFLDFRKADAPENCRKALEYALLLPRPQVGALDSLALNISADKLFSQGDSFGAIKEYQLALLADEGNAMAWNSLGICLAALGRDSEAERHFSRALECSPGDVMALYNLGYMHQSQRRDPDAARCYKACLEQDPEHLYAMLRLGQIAENAGDFTQAREWYGKAADLPGGENLTCRHFARLCLAEGSQEEAREYLHEALLHDPQDAVSLQLLARLYLDAGEDPDLAAGLARQSVSLWPGLKSGWLELARALEALGKSDEARQARLRAGES